MKKLTSSLLFAALLALGLTQAACATSHSTQVSGSGLAVAGRSVGTQGSTRARAFDGVAMSSQNNDSTGRDPRGIPTPQPVRDPSASAHAIPVPQPPIPTPDHHGSTATSRVGHWAE
jgi:hypothetical protein